MRTETHRSIIVLVLLGVLGAGWSCSKAQEGKAPAGSPPAASGPADTATATASAPANVPTTATAAAVRRAHVFISGGVQNVGYRAWTEGQARGLGLTGWVKNLADGRVEAVVEGPASAVGELMTKMKTGPSSARVTDVAAKDEPPTGEFRTFTTTYDSPR